MSWGFQASSTYKYFLLISWCFVQLVFFLPEKGLSVYQIEGECGIITVLQTGRHADLWGACSDRFQRFARFQLVPLLKQKGVFYINKIILEGNQAVQIAALPELQKNFSVETVYYYPDRVERMRGVFKCIKKGTQIRRIQPPLGS